MITERLPWYQKQTLIYDEDFEEFRDVGVCQRECPYIGPEEEQLFRGFITEWCPIGTMPDENLHC